MYDKELNWLIDWIRKLSLFVQVEVEAEVVKMYRYR